MWIIENQHGGVFVMTMFVMSILIILGLSLALMVHTGQEKVADYINRTKARYLAAAGLEKILVEYLIIDPNNDWTDNGHRTIYDNENLGNGTFIVMTNNSSSNSIAISSTGVCRQESVTILSTATINWQALPLRINLQQWQE
jgi:hypothetical protein